MFLYRAPFDPKKGPYIKIFISKPISRYSHEDAEKSKMKVDMLLDTGASKSFISPVIAHQIGLEPIGQEYFMSVTNKVKTNIHIADLEIEKPVPGLFLPTVILQEFSEQSPVRDGILGRDFLSTITFEMNGPQREFSLTKP
ncbi:MAG: retropepsin-like aspartic protease [Bdellovibrionales bacterium]